MEATVSQRTSLTAVTLAASLLLVGCASDDDAPGGNGEAPASTTTNEPASPTNTASTPPESPDAPSDGAADSAEPSASEEIPTDPADYADALIQAWGIGDDDRMGQLANDEVIDALTDVAMPGGSHWDQTGADSGAGSSFVSYTNTETGATVDLRVENETASAGEQHAVVEVKTGE